MKNTKKIFWFQKKDPREGNLLDEYVDAEERIAWNHLKDKSRYKYIGWSDGRFIKGASKYKRKYIVTENVDLDLLEEENQKVEENSKIVAEAIKQEIEFARQNPEPPRDLTISDPWGTLDQTDLNRIKKQHG